MKMCTKCRDVKPLTDFYPRRNTGGVTSACKKCGLAATLASRQKRRLNDPEASSAATRRGNLRRFGMDAETFDLILEAQGGRCAICGTDAPGGHGRFHIDHDHACCPGKKSCGKCVRGLLCHGCNTGIGSLKHSAFVLESAAVFLRSQAEMFTLPFVGV